MTVTTAFVANWYEIVLGQAMKQAKLNEYQASSLIKVSLGKH
jgi:hypothetical protein